MKISSVLAIFLIITLSFSGCTSNTSLSNSGGLTSTTPVSQNSDDLYIQYIAEYENGYLNIITPYMSLKMQDSSDYAKMKSTFTELRTLSNAYQGKIEPLNVSSKYELSKKYYLESLKQRQLYSEATLAGPYPNNPSNSVEVDSFINYMISLRPFTNSAKNFFNNAMIAEVCTNLLEKQNYSISVCNSNVIPVATVTPFIAATKTINGKIWTYVYERNGHYYPQPSGFVCTESNPQGMIFFPKDNYTYDPATSLETIWCER